MVASVQHDRGARRQIAELPLELILLPVAILTLGAIMTGLPSLTQGDPQQYLAAVNQLLGGQLPYRDFGSEYPPLAFVVWLLPRLISGDHQTSFTWLLAAENMAFAVIVALSLVALSVKRWAAASPSRALAVLAFLVVGVAPVAPWRFDLSAAALLALGLVLASRERNGWAGAVLGIGTLVKVFPAVIVAVLLLKLLAEGRRGAASRLGVAFGAVIAAVMVPVLLVAGSGGLSFLTYQSERGLQLESVGAGLVLLAHQVLGGPLALQHAFGSWQISAPLGDVFVAMQPVVLAGLLVCLLASAALRFRQEWRETGGVDAASVVAYATAAVLITIVANKVFSPQYEVWLLPLVPLLPRRQAALGIGAALLTLLIFPQFYGSLMAFHPPLVAVLNARNLLLVALVAWLWWQRAPRLRARDTLRMPAVSG